MNWSEGSSYLLPASKGIACGCIHKPATTDNDATDNESAAVTESEQKNEDDAKAEIPTDSSTTTNTSTATTVVKDMIVYALKVSSETLESMNSKSTPEELPCWVQKSYELFQQCLSTEKIKAEQPNDDTKQNTAAHDGVEKNELEGIKLSNDESLTMNLIIELALDDPFFGWNSHMPDR